MRENLQKFCVAPNARRKLIKTSSHALQGYQIKRGAPTPQNTSIT